MLNKLYDLNFYKRNFDHFYIKSYENVFKKYQLHETICVCGNKEYKNILKFDRCKNRYEIIICKNCGIIRPKFYFSRKDIINLYQTDYRNDKLKTHEKSDYLYKKLSEAKNIRDNWDIIEQYVNFSGSRKLKILDIGAGGGGFLDKYKNIHECYAADYETNWLGHAEKNNIKIIKGGIKEVLKKKIRFDLIILNHVVEHWSDFESEIKDLKKLCEIYKTKVFIEVPGLDSLKLGRRNGDIREDVVFYHYHYFTSYTLKILFEKYGFECLYKDSIARLIFTLSNEKITINYSGHYDKVLKDIDVNIVFKLYFLTKQIFVKKINKFINLIIIKEKLKNFIRFFRPFNLFKKIYNQITLINYIKTKYKYKKIIHLHAPQCGGNSINFFLKLNLGFRLYQFRRNTNKYLGDYINRKEYIITTHTGVNFIKNYLHRQDIFYLLSIRNPKNRLLSNYYRNKKLFLENNPGKNFFSLEQFLKLRVDTKLDNLFTRYLLKSLTYDGCSDNDFINQNDYNEALDNLKYINFVNIIDDDDSFNKLKKHLNIIIPFSNLFKLQKNKVSDSIYPDISINEKMLLEKLTIFDQKLYNFLKDV